MTDTLPVYREEPTGVMAHVLRKMLSEPLTAVREAGRLVGEVGGEHVSGPTIAGLLTRRLILEHHSTALVTHYTLTPAGVAWATGRKR